MLPVSRTRRDPWRKRTSSRFSSRSAAFHRRASSQRARIKPADAESLHRRARENNVSFWAELASKELTWHKPFTKAFDDSEAPNYRWFSDGQLNASVNCLDIHLQQRGHKTALIFEGEPGDVRRLSYRELHAEVCRFANVLKAQGVGRGDRVIIYLPLVPEIVIARSVSRSP